MLGSSTPKSFSGSYAINVRKVSVEIDIPKSIDMVIGDEFLYIRRMVKI